MEIPYLNLDRAKSFYESVFEFKIVDLEVGDEIYPCFPNKNGEGFSGALVKYDFTKPGKSGPLVYLNPYGKIDDFMQRVVSAGGKSIKNKTAITSGFGYFSIFEDSEGNMLALQGEA